MSKIVAYLFLINKLRYVNNFSEEQLRGDRHRVLEEIGLTIKKPYPYKKFRDKS